MTPTPIPAFAPVLKPSLLALSVLPVEAVAVDVPIGEELADDGVVVADEDDIEEVELDVALEANEKVVVIVASALTGNCSPPSALSLSSYFVSLKLHSVGN